MGFGHGHSACLDPYIAVLAIREQIGARWRCDMAHLNSPPFDEKDFPAFSAIREKFGFLPNFYPAQVARPDLLDAEMKLMESILFHDAALSRKQIEYIFLTCSAANLSTYCVTAHCEIVRLLGIEGPEPEQIAIDHVHSRISIADKALLNFCAKLNLQRSKVGRSDIEALRTYGFNDQQILEAIVTVGFAQFANTVAFGLGTVPDFRNTKVETALAHES
jgi:uncharacterized peroxidase-related enzyme